MLPDQTGLTNAKAQELLQSFGPNLLPEQPLPGSLKILLSQFKSPLVYVLLFAGVVTLLLQHLSDSLIIFASVFINTILGFVQEKKANHSLASLKQFVTKETEVIREGVRTKIKSANLVPGDIVLLSEGAKIPADGFLVLANRLFIDESIITGENVSISKSLKEEVFMGTTVVAGQGTMQVTTTGVHTRIGGIAVSVQNVKEDTPLGKQLGCFSQKLVVVILVLVFLVFITGLLQGKELTEMFTTAIALAVSSIPEGLLVSLTVVLAIGMQKILKRRGLVRKLSSAETLGSVTTICVDKTGTLTEGKMKVVEFWGDKKDLAQQVLLANDLDDPIVIAAFSWGRTIIKKLIGRNDRLDSIPFSSKERFFTSLHKWTSKSNMVFVNGAPDILLQWSNLSASDKQEISQKINDLTSLGYRLLGLARKEVSPHKKTLELSDAKSDLTWIGLIALTDPVRPSVKAALKTATQAGIRIIVITGDYPKTAEYVLTEIGQPVSAHEVILGTQLEKLSLEQLSQQVKTVKLFARTTPDQKLKIVEALQKNGEIVAMMGDGVNDAPAIHAADIGIAVSDASDVAKESADLILLDSNFATIVASIEEGRNIFNNIRKIILYLLSDSFSEIVLITLGILIGIPLPITAVQIIWINLVSDGFPGLALTVDPQATGVMQEKPRSSQEQLVNSWMFSLIGIVSVTTGLIALFAFVATYRLTADLTLARSIAFIMLGLKSSVYVFSVRSLMVPFWRTNILENKWLLVAVVAGFALLYLPFANPSLQTFFGVADLSIFHWLIALALSMLIFVVIEVFKYLNQLHPSKLPQVSFS